MQTMPAVRGLTIDSPLPVHRQREIEVEAISRPARTFTGDFYFTHRHGDRVWFAHGDVAGKGLPAAIVMAMIQEELEHRITACAETKCDPASTTTRLHEFLLPLLPQNRFATAVIGHLRDDGTLTIANAGHCPPLIVRNDGSIEEIDSTGPLLGILRRASWRSITTHLDPGESLVLYSDGVTESIADDRELGVCGLRETIRRVGPSPSAIIEEIGVASDDVTLVTVTRVCYSSAPKMKADAMPAAVFTSAGSGRDQD